MNISANQQQFYLYYVFYRNLDDGGDWENVGTKENFINLVALRPGTLYGIRILVAINHGNGLASKEMEIRTVAGGKEEFFNYSSDVVQKKACNAVLILKMLTKTQYVYLSINSSSILAS